MPRSSSDYPAPFGTGAAKPRPEDVLRAAVDLFVLGSAHERPQIRAFADLVAGLLPDVGRDLREHAADRLAQRADTPPLIARMLALDEISVAEPVILSSPVLTSSDLVEIMHRSPEHFAVVARRLDLAPDVASTLTRSIEREERLERTPRGEPRRPSQAIDRPVTDIVEEAMRARPVASSEDEGEIALQRALDELAAELAAEAEARASEEAELRALRDETPVVPGEIDGFLDLDPAARWRIIQEANAAASLAPPPVRGRRAADPAAIGARLFSALVAGDRTRLGDDLAEAAELDRAVVERILTDRHGEAFAVVLAAMGVDERTATSILLLHTGENATLAHMQDLSAMAGRIGWRTAEHLVSRWRAPPARGRIDALRMLDPVERRGIGRAESAADPLRGSTDTGRRRAGDGRD